MKFIDILKEKAALMETILRHADAQSATGKLERLYARLDRELRELQPEAGKISGRLAPETDSVRRKILHNIHYLKERVARHELQRHSAITGDIDRIYNFLYPNGNLQERELCILPLMAAHGPAVMGSIRQAIDVEHFNHIVLTI